MLRQRCILAAFAVARRFSAKRVFSSVPQCLSVLPKPLFARHLSSSILDKEYMRMADATLDALSEHLDGLCEVHGAECDYSSGVLTLRLGSMGTYVINRQPPTRQIWLSSPVSGPQRYEWDSSRREWVHWRDGSAPTLRALLSAELSVALKKPVIIPPVSL